MLLEISRVFSPIIEKAHAAHKEAIAQRTRLEAPLRQAETVLKGRVVAFLDQEAALRRVEEARLMAAQAQAEESRRVAEAAALEQAGLHVEAEAVLTAPPPPPVPVTLAPPQADGVSTREVWRAEVRDLAALVRAVAEGKVPAAAVEPCLPFLNGQARALKGLMAYPGVQAVKETVVAVKP